MTARLILNLKSAGDTPNPSADQHPALAGTTMSAFEAAVLGNIGNKFEDEDDGSSDTLGPYGRFEWERKYGIPAEMNELGTIQRAVQAVRYEV